MRAIQVSCPGTVNLFYNIHGYDYENKHYIFTSVNQMIDLFDKITIREERSNGNDVISINNGIAINTVSDRDKNISDAAKYFFEYTDIKNRNISITVNKNIPLNSGFYGYNSDIIGTLTALNCYYNTNLSGKDLVSISSKINKYAPIYLYGDLTMIDMEGIKPLYNHYYNNYIIAIPKFDLKNNIYEDAKNRKYDYVTYDYKKVFNCISDMLPDELKRLRDYLNKYNEFNHNVMGMSNNYLIAFPDDKDINRFILDINKKFPKYKLLSKKRADGFKLLKMYK